MTVLTPLPAPTHTPAPGEARPAPGRRRALSGGLNIGARSTPARLTVLMVALATLAAGAGVAAVIGEAQRSSDIDSVVLRSGPLTVEAQELYRSLSDADAVAASAFLSGGEEPAALRQRYLNDIAAATAALSDATAGDPGQPAVERIAAQLPVYTGLVETARTYNRLDLPVGAAYLREASALMRGQLLTAAKQLYAAETARFAADRGDASGFPWIAVPLGVLSLAGLAYAQQRLTRRTNRMVNLGLAGATLIGVAGFAWLVASWSTERHDLTSAQRDGSAQVQLLAQARIDALQARADEALTLVARGNGADYETDYQAMLDDLVGEDGHGGLLARAREQASDPAVAAAVRAAATDVGHWRDVHQHLASALNDSGDYPAAVKGTIGDDPSSAASAFNSVDKDLAGGIGTANTTMDSRARAAGHALGGAPVGLAVLGALMVTGVVVGLRQRIGEYR